MTEWMSRLLGLTIRDISILKNKWMSRSDWGQKLVQVIPAIGLLRRAYGYGKIATSGVSVVLRGMEYRADKSGLDEIGRPDTSYRGQ
jgi:hypothetical protein